MLIIINYYLIGINSRNDIDRKHNKVETEIYTINVNLLMKYKLELSQIIRELVVSVIIKFYFIRIFY